MPAKPPAFIQPLDGIASRTTSYRVLYALMRPFMSLLNPLIRKHFTTTRVLGKALVTAAKSGASVKLLHTAEINALGA